MIEKVLIVDNSQLFREGLSKILLEIGIKQSNIAIVDNGVDGIDFLMEVGADLIICHDNLEDLTIADLHSAVQSTSSGHKVKLLALTQSRECIPQVKTFSIPKIVYLAKPFNPSNLLNALFSLTNDSIFEKTLCHKDQEEPANPTTEKKGVEVDKPRVLVVDDESINIEVASAHLSPLYRVMAVKSGEVAIKLAKKNHDSISLILLDIMMPNVDGYEVCRQLKADPQTADIPIIFITAKTEIADITKGFAIGAVDYITKPIQGEVLLARVATHIKLQQSKKLLANQVKTLEENERLRADIERITQHDLKGPLSSILFETYQLENKTAAKSIAKAVNNVVNMINHSLDVFKIEQGEYSLQPSMVSMSGFVIDAINAFTSIAHQKNIELKTQGLDAEHTILAEPLLCLSIFNNLVKNAIEAAPSDSQINIKIETEENKENFIIRNQGTVPKELRDTLFEKYTSSSKNRGTGLGTYSAKLMTEVQNGTINFFIIDESQTEFVVSMPKS